MSHFAVLVIGPDPERQLAPYHEFECTGMDDEYVDNVRAYLRTLMDMADITKLFTILEEESHG